jgi:hypothetical protein
MARKYEPRALTIESLLGWIKPGEIAVPEIQRPFVWDGTSVANPLDSLCNGGDMQHGNIVDRDELAENLAMNRIPQGIEHMTVDDYPDFLVARRQLMAQKIKTYFEGL